MNLPKIILASGSPRRAEILNFVGWEFEKHTADIDESVLENETPESYVQRLAREKASAIAVHSADMIVLGADTIVLLDGEIIGKPKDLADARKMLEKLSGRRHEVLTGVALVKNEKAEVDLQRTQVKFAEMTSAEIEFLVENGAPLDKAGAYAVQAQAALFIEFIEGDYWNVVGLPINLVYRLAAKFT